VRPQSDLAPNSLALGDDGADLPVTAIPHGAIARLCVDSLAHANAGRSTLCAMATAEPGTGAASWTPLLEEVRPDRRAFRDDLLQEHFVATRVGGGALVAALATFATAAALALKALVGALIGFVGRL
jgi:hypothetical protein